jgi:hypothetical protein
MNFFELVGAIVAGQLLTDAVIFVTIRTYRKRAVKKLRAKQSALLDSLMKSNPEAAAKVQALVNRAKAAGSE